MALRTVWVTYVKINRADSSCCKLGIVAEFLISSSRCELIYKSEILFVIAAMACRRH